VVGVHEVSRLIRTSYCHVLLPDIFFIETEDILDYRMPPDF
jgi:hypothetical protein